MATSTAKAIHIFITPAQVFRRKIKADPTLFPGLKVEKYHDLWHQYFASQARAQDVSEVLDSAYIPVNQDGHKPVY
jgi:hypothetical protein